MRAVIILFNIDKIDKKYLEDALVIGADKGALNAVSKGIKLDIAIGDFDSVTNDEFELIKNNSKKIIKLNPIKDETDTKEALELVKAYDEIIILGGIKGNRIEHFYANLLLFYKYKNLKMIDDNSLIEAHDESFKPNLDYKFISIFSLDDNTNITLSGFKYNIENYSLKMSDPLGISNEIIDSPYITINSGKILIIYTKNDKE